MRQVTVCLAVILAVASGIHGSIFSVGHAGGVSRNGKIKFENVLTDSDNSWNRRRSLFECYDPGYYYFTFHGLARKNAGLTLQLLHNNRELVRAHGDGSGYNTASNSAIANLNFGDKILLKVVDGSLHESDRPSRNYVTLSGFKISGGDGPQFGGGSAGGFAAAAPGGGSSGPENSDSPPAFGAPPATGTDSDGGEDEEFTPLSSDSGSPSR